MVFSGSSGFNKTDLNHVTEILLKVALSVIKPKQTKPITVMIMLVVNYSFHIIIFSIDMIYKEILIIRNIKLLPIVCINKNKIHLPQA